MSEPNITLYLNTVVYDVEKEGDCVCTITAFNPQNATSYRFTGTYFCDASGDGIVSYMAGASYRAGAEDAAEFGEGFPLRNNMANSWDIPYSSIPRRRMLR